MMKLAKISFLAIALLIFSGPEEAEAQRTVELGPRFGLEVNNIETVTVGAGARFHAPGIPLVINPTFDFYLSDSGSTTPDGREFENMIQGTTNLLYEFGFDNQVFTPYAGPGVSVLYTSFPQADGDFSLGFNAVGGASIHLLDWVRPYIQAQFVVGGDYEPTSFNVGVLFTL